MKLGRKLAAVLVTLAMLLCLAPVAAFAATTEVKVGEEKAISLTTTEKEILKSDNGIPVATMAVEPNSVYRIQVHNLEVANCWDATLYALETAEDNLNEMNDFDDFHFSEAVCSLEYSDSCILSTDENCTEVTFYLQGFADDDSEKLSIDLTLEATETQYADKMVQVGQTKTIPLSKEETGVDLGMTCYPSGSAPWQPYYDETIDYDWCGYDTDDIVWVEYDESTGTVTAYPQKTGTTGVTLYLTNGKEVQKFYYKITVVDNYTKVIPGVPSTFVVTQFSDDGDSWETKVGNVVLPDTLNTYRVDILYVGTPGDLMIEMRDSNYDDMEGVDFYQELPGVTHASFLLTPGTSAKYGIYCYMSNLYDSNENTIPAAGTFTVLVTKAVTSPIMKFDSDHYYGYILNTEQPGFIFDTDNNLFGERENVLQPMVDGMIPLDCTGITSSDESVAAINSKYQYHDWYTDQDKTGSAVVPVAPGTTTLTATMENGTTATAKFTSLEPETLEVGKTYNLDDFPTDVNGYIWFTSKVSKTDTYRLIVMNDECDFSTGASVSTTDYNYAWNYSYVADEYYGGEDAESQIKISNNEPLGVYYENSGTKIKLVTEEEYVSYMKKLVTGHHWDTEYTVDEKATCNSVGVKSLHCTDEDCDVTIAATEIPALGHNWNKKNVCTRCGANCITTTVEKGATITVPEDNFGYSWGPEDGYEGDMDLESEWNEKDDTEVMNVTFSDAGVYDLSIDLDDDETIDYVFIVK